MKEQEIDMLKAWRADLKLKREGAPMPLYQYRCPACDTLYEELQRPDDAPAPCPACRTPGERQISAPAPAIIKGTEKNPYKKTKAQLSQEIDEQIRDNEIPPDLADAQAKLADL
jgi:putative FmdB family regulatory protein